MKYLHRGYKIQQISYHMIIHDVWD